MSVKLNLGSGGEPREGYVNIDKNPCALRVDVVHDLDRYPWPFESEVADEILMEHCLEHLIDHNRAMKEIHRILKKGALARISVLHFTWQFAFMIRRTATFSAIIRSFTMLGTAGILISNFHLRIFPALTVDAELIK